jgi:hypothetical protein
LTVCRPTVKVKARPRGRRPRRIEFPRLFQEVSPVTPALRPGFDDNGISGIFSPDLMLPSDRLEFEILDRVVECTDHLGFPTNLSTLSATLRNVVGACSDRETSAAIARLWQEHNLAVGRFTGTAWILRNQVPDISYLFDGDFRLLPTPASWRHRDTLRHARKRGVFISHISEESSIAAALKVGIRQAFGGEFPVFVSSDTTSIKSGKPWYDEILAHLRTAEVVIVLVTKRSVDRRWINFEAGVGLGENSAVIPAVVGSFQKGSIGLPLSHLQARDIGNVLDLTQLLQDIAETCLVKTKPVDYEAIAIALDAAETAIPDSDVELRFWRDAHNVLECALRNSGAKAVHPSEVEILLPRAVVDQNFSFMEFGPVLHKVKRKIDGIEYEGFILTTIPSPDLRVKTQPLPSVLSRDMVYRRLLALRIPLKGSLTPSEENLAIHYRVSGSDVSVGPASLPIIAVTGEDPIA